MFTYDDLQDSLKPNADSTQSDNFSLAPTLDDLQARQNSATASTRGASNATDYLNNYLNSTAYAKGPIAFSMTSTEPTVTEQDNGLSAYHDYLNYQNKQLKDEYKQLKDAYDMTGESASKKSVIKYNGSNNFGASAYGVSGRTGLASQKGDAPYGLQRTMWNSLRSAFNDMQAAGLGKPGITDGWRSYQSQVDLKRRKGDIAATPGRSVHGLGYAADLSLNSRQQRWLEKHGAEYGLRRLRSESWHWQYMPDGRNLKQNSSTATKKSVVSRLARTATKPVANGAFSRITRMKNA